MPQTWFISGGAGFIGSQFVRLLLDTTDLQVVNLDKLTYAASSLALNEIWNHPNHHFVRGDIADRDLVRQLLRQFKPQKIVHVAAESHVDRSIDSPGDFVSTNVVGTYALLEEALDYWQSLSREEKLSFRFVHVSTDEVYGSADQVGTFHESTPYAPRSPYSASKAASDHFVQAYHHTYGLPTIITHGSNTYGPYQFPEKLIPVMIRNAIIGKPLPIYGDGLHIRNWMFVDDHGRGLQTVAERGQPGEVYNLAGDQECTNLEMVEMLCEILEPHLSSQNSIRNLITFVPDRPGHDRRYSMDTTKIRRELGWTPQVTLEQGLPRTVQWYLEHQHQSTTSARQGLRRFAS